MTWAKCYAPSAPSLSVTGKIGVYNQHLSSTFVSAPTETVYFSYGSATVTITDVSSVGVPGKPVGDPLPTLVFRVQATVAGQSDYYYIAFYLGDATPWDIELDFEILIEPKGGSGLEREHSISLFTDKNSVTHAGECHVEDQWNAEVQYVATIGTATNTIDQSIGGTPLSIGGDGVGGGMGFNQHKADHASWDGTKAAAIFDVKYDNAGISWVEQTIAATANMRVDITANSMEWDVVTNFSGGDQSWDGAGGVPYVVDFSKVQAFNWTGSSLAERDDPKLQGGWYDIAGVEIFPTLQEIHGWGVVAWVDWDFEDRVRPFPSPLVFTQYQDWGNDENERLFTDVEYTDDNWIISAAHLAVAPDEDPWFNAINFAQLASVDVIEPLGVFGRPANWVGNPPNLVVASDDWTLFPTGVVPVAYIDLINNIDDRVFPDKFWQKKANNNNPGAIENPWYWYNYRYAELAFDVPEETEVEVEIRYYTETNSDNHVTGSSRVMTRTRSALQILTKSITFAAGTNVKRTIDLMLPDTIDIDEAVHIRVTFPTVSAIKYWKFRSFKILLDPGDPVTLRSAVEPHSRYKNRRPWDVIELGTSGHTDGKPTLKAGDYFRTHWPPGERGMPWISWLYGAETGVNLSRAFTIEEIATHLNQQEGYTASFDDTNFDAVMKDVDDVYLHNTGYTTWLDPKAFDNLEPDPGGTGTNVILAGMAVRSWNIAGHITYTPTVVQVMRGQVTGFVRSSDSAMSRDNGGSVLGDSKVIDIYRRPPGGDWELYASADPNQHGRYESVGLQVMQDAPFTRWEWGTTNGGGVDDVTLVSEAYRREYIWRDENAAGGDTSINFHSSGVLWRAFYSDGKVKLQISPSISGGWSKPFGSIAVSGVASSISIIPSGSVVMLAFSDETGPNQYVSYDSGVTWSDIN